MIARLEGVHGGQGVAEGRPVDARYVGQAVAGGVRVRCCCHHPRMGAHVCTLTRGVEGGDSSRARCKLVWSGAEDGGTAAGSDSSWAPVLCAGHP